MKTTSSISMIVAILLGTVLSAGSDSTVSAMSIGSLNMYSENLPVVLVVNKDQFEGNWKQFKGDLKKQWGK